MEYQPTASVNVPQGKVLDPSTSSTPSVFGNRFFMFVSGLMAGLLFAWIVVMVMQEREVGIFEKAVAPTSAVETKMADEGASLPKVVKDFREVLLRGQDGYALSLSQEDEVLKEKMVAAAIRHEKAFSDYGLEGFVISGNLVLGMFGVPKGCPCRVYVVYDRIEDKILDSFRTLGETYFLNDKTFVVMSGSGPLRSYTYGKATSQELVNSTLLKDQTYFSGEGPEGSSAYGVIATSTNSITVGVFNLKKGATAPGDDFYRYEKLGERTFVLP